MADMLTWHPQRGTLFGQVSGRVTGLAVDPADPSTGRVWNWEKVQELRSGRYATGHGDSSGEYVLTGVQHRASTTGRRLVVASNARLEVFDYPGAYAQRFDGGTRPPPPAGPVPIPYPTIGASRSPGGDVDQPLILGMPPGAAPWFDPNFQGGVFVATASGLLIHAGPPRRGPIPTILVRSGWSEFFEAARMTRQITIVVEM